MLGFPMKDKQSKKVVIISDIRSDTIEQAIFILRSAGAAVSGDSPGAHIVREAQRVINAYVQTVEKTSSGLERKEKKCRRSGKNTISRDRRGIYAALAVAGFCTAAYLLYRIFGSVMAGF